MADKKIEHVKDLKFDPKNARTHTEKNISMLVDGVQEVGMGRSILIDAEGEIIAGNGVVEGATAAGITKVRVIETDGTEIIAVRRSDLKGKKKTRMALLDNRAQEVGGGWNSSVLKDLAHDDPSQLKGLWNEEELEFLLNKKLDTEADPISPESANNMPPESSIERIILWIPKDRHPEFQLNVRNLGELTGVDDVGLIILEALRQANG